MDSHAIKVLRYLTYPLLLLLGISSFCGAFVPGTYGRDALSLAVQGQGQDLVNLGIVIPLWAFSLRGMARGRIRATLLFGGAGFYTLYSYFIYAFGVHFNYLFLVYCLILGLSLFLFVFYMRKAEGLPVGGWLRETAPKRATSIFFFTIAAVFYILWLSDVVPALIGGSLPASVSDYDLLVNPVHILDLSFMLPALIVAGILLLRGHPTGYLLSGIFLVFIVLLSLALLGMMAMLYYREINESPVISLLFLVMAAFSTYFFVRLFSANSQD